MVVIFVHVAVLAMSLSHRFPSCHSDTHEHEFRFASLDFTIQDETPLLC